MCTSLLAVPLLLSLVACSDEPVTPGLPTNLPVLQTLWSLPEVKTLGITSLQGDLLLAGSEVRAVNVRTRQLAFSLPNRVDRDRTSFASVGNDVLVIENGPGSLMRLIDRTGKTLNTIAFPSKYGVSLRQQGPYVFGNALYVGSGPTLYKYDVAALRTPGVQPIWQKTLSTLYLQSLFAADEHRIFVGTDGNRLVSLDGQGKERWSVQLDAPETTLAGAYVLALNGNTLITQAGRNGLQAYDADTGQRAWEQFSSVDVCPSGAAPAEFSIELAAGMVFFGHAGGSCVLAFHADTGKLAWVFDAPVKGTFDTKPLYVNGVVYANNSRLWALDAQSGELLASSPANQYLGANVGAPLSYDPVDHQVMTWGNTGVYAYKPLR
ncbi:PQQ-binding-like beta-propeller repeat protein [Deinococcus oregonensis]|uniref:PQQ-binding-like beta-propeller repeat protein n=1 Tax=Deinococcus oregonensis TaxID=1805970 RepID=A0ABV6B1C0_9DEIO